MSWLGRHKYKLSLGATLVVSFGVVAYKSYGMLSSPAAGTIKSPEKTVESMEFTPDKREQTLQSKFITLKYPAAMTSVSDTSQQNPGVLEQYQLMTQHPTGNDILVVTVKKLPQGGLAEESSYRLRQTQADQYEESREKLGANDLVLVRHRTNQEAVAYATGNGMLTIIALKSTRAGVNIMNDIKSIAHTFSWLK
jgi:hypothetical protein